MRIAKVVVLSLSAAVLGLSSISCTSTRNSNGQDGENMGRNGSHSSSGLTLNTVYFDFDRYNVRADQQPAADAMAESLKDHPNVKVQIQGNTDDRGSVEYNMALGTKRADALKKYLVASGVNSDNVDTVSYGKERPAVQGNDESAWALNRRDDVVQVN